jgi:multiple sugar transport system substrate-binding protein
MKHILIGTALGAMAVTGVSAQEVSLGRFFGACEDAGTDTTTSSGEACIIQSIINAADAELDGITVNTLPTDWGNYYDQIIAAYAGGEPPDVHVMHRHRVPQFAGLGALAELSGDLEAAGIDVSDWAPAALDAVSFNGGIYGVPMDFHANLWHVNMEIMAEAGLVNDDGTPILPSSPAELMEHAAMVEAATGHDYLAADFAQFPIGVRLVLSLMWQQGENIFTEDGTATINNDAARNAVTSITQLFDAGHANPQLNYADSQQAFLNGEAAILVNGTWVVDFYDAEAANADVALSDYYVADFPTLFARAQHGPIATCGRSPRRCSGTIPKPTPQHFRFWPLSTSTISTGRAPGTWPCAIRFSAPKTTQGCRIAMSTPARPPSPATRPQPKTTAPFRTS